MDITGLSLDEIETLFQQLSERYNELKAEAAAEQNTRTGRISDALTTLDALLSPETGGPGTDNLRAVRRFDEATMAANAGVGLALAFQALEVLATTVRDIAATIAADQTGGTP